MSACVCVWMCCYLNWVDGDGDDDGGEADYLGAVSDMDFSSLGVGVVSRRKNLSLSLCVYICSVPSTTTRSEFPRRCR